jgi:two-component system response regulator HydG
LEPKPDNRHSGIVSPNVLVVDDEESTRQLCVDFADEVGLQSQGVSTTEEALAILEARPVDLVITDLKVPSTGGLELLRTVRAGFPQTSVIVLTQFGTIETAIEAMRLGAADFVTKPFHAEEMRARLARVVRSIELDQENRILREQLRTRPGFGGLVGTSAKMQKVYKLIEKAAHGVYPVLILGESGTGKELVARSIHFLGPRSKEPFFPVDCSALAPTLIESELFGHVRGAFTGAHQSKRGLLEAAGAGTLFLDEIGNLPVDLQAKLLRALQEREFKPIGANQSVAIHSRMIAATNSNLEVAVREGRFRQDLFFRLNVVPIKLPPLRERKSDIPLLVNYFLEKNSVGDVPMRAFSEDALRHLISYDWPGNVRELENAVERAVALSSGPVLQLNDLPTNLQLPQEVRAVDDDQVVPLDLVEKKMIFRALQETGGDKLAAARILGIGKTTLYRKLKEYGERFPS